jgi:hypothetical protein
MQYYNPYITSRPMNDAASRRRFLAAAAAGGALLLGRPRGAAALTIEPMDVDAANALAAACGGAQDDHRRRARRLAAANAALPEAERLSPAALDRLLTSTRCPVCGCAIGPLGPSAADG